MEDILKNKKILIVDDEPLILDIVKTIITANGGIADGKRNADNIIQILRENSYDLLILDRYIGETDGVDVLKTIKSTDFINQIPVIMLTGETEKREILNSIKAGARGYVIKPFKPNELMQQISQVLTPNKKTDNFEVDV